MKRSEMLLNIASTLVDERTEFMRFDKAQEMAEMILSMVEKNGMKPPKSGKKEAFCNNYDGSYFYPLYNWESENEKI